MKTRAKWWLSALVLSAEALTVGAMLWTGEGQAWMRTVYVRSWTYVTPHLPPPDRFLPPR